MFVYQQGDHIELLLNQAGLLCIYILCELGSQEFFCGLKNQIDTDERILLVHQHGRFSHYLVHVYLKKRIKKLNFHVNLSWIWA